MVSPRRLDRTSHRTDIQIEKTSAPLLEKYAPKLPKTYEPQILATYEKLLVQLASQANKRIDYETLVFTTFKEVCKIKGGKELTNKLTLQWLEQYKRRPAFCEVMRTYRNDNGM